MSEIDLSFRPQNYFWSLDHGIRLASDIQGVARRRMYERALALGDDTTMQRMMSEATLGAAERRLIGGLHPALMGGEFLPPRKSGEVEIARIVIASTTYDTFCVNARRNGDCLAYQVVDEYEGGCLDEQTCMSIRPLSLGELFDFLISAWDLWGCLEANFADHGYPPDRVLGFIVEASSSFYAEFGDLVTERVEQWVLQKRQASKSRSG